MSQTPTDHAPSPRPANHHAHERLGKPRFRVGSLLKSSVVGVVATAVDFLLLWLLVGGLGWTPRWANLPALTGGLVVQFFGNKIYAFEDHCRPHLRQTSRFLLVETGAFLLNALSFHCLVTLSSISYVAARLIGSAAVYFFFSYPLWHWVFRPTPRVEPLGVLS